MAARPAGMEEHMYPGQGGCWVRAQQYVTAALVRQWMTKASHDCGPIRCKSS